MADRSGRKRLTDHPQDFGYDLKPDDTRVVAAEKHLEKMTDDLRRLQERADGLALPAPFAAPSWLRWTWRTTPLDHP